MLKSFWNMTWQKPPLSHQETLSDGRQPFTFGLPVEFDNGQGPEVGLIWEWTDWQCTGNFTYEVLVLHEGRIMITHAEKFRPLTPAEIAEVGPQQVEAVK